MLEFANYCISPKEVTGRVYSEGLTGKELRYLGFSKHNLPDQVFFTVELYIRYEDGEPRPHARRLTVWGDDSNYKSTIRNIDISAHRWENGSFEDMLMDNFYHLYIQELNDKDYAADEE